MITEIISGSAKATKNDLRLAGMLETPIEEVTEFTVPTPENRVRRFEHPRSKYSGIVRLLVEPGEKVTKNQAIAKITDIHGKPLGDGFIRTDHDGYMIALKDEVTIYPNEHVAEMGIKDDYDIVVPMPPKK